MQLVVYMAGGRSKVWKFLLSNAFLYTRFYLVLKPMGRITRSPNQGQSVAPKSGPWSNKKLKKKGFYFDQIV